MHDDVPFNWRRPVAATYLLCYRVHVVREDRNRLGYQSDRLHWSLISICMPSSSWFISSASSVLFWFISLCTLQVIFSSSHSHHPLIPHSFTLRWKRASSTNLPPQSSGTLWTAFINTQFSFRSVPRTTSTLLLVVSLSQQQDSGTHYTTELSQLSGIVSPAVGLLHP